MVLLVVAGGDPAPRMGLGEHEPDCSTGQCVRATRTAQVDRTVGGYCITVHTVNCGKPLIRSTNPDESCAGTRLGPRAPNS